MRVNNRSLFKPRAKGIYKVDNKAEEATVYLYDEISWFGIEADKFARDFDAITANTIHLRINSPGGSVFDGTNIANVIRRHKAKIIAHIDGLAASIASVIAMAADEIRMSDNAFMMIHEPWSIVAGSSTMMRDEADLLDKVGIQIAQAYVNKSGKELNDVLDIMAAETWFTAQEALDAGLIDFIDSSKNTKAKMDMFDLSVFAHVPEKLKEERQLPTATDWERILRDAGCSTKQAKAFISKGLAEAFRDVEPEIILDEITAADPPPRDVVEPVKELAELNARELILLAKRNLNAKRSDENVNNSAVQS